MCARLVVVKGVVAKATKFRLSLIAVAISFEKKRTKMSFRQLFISTNNQQTLSKVGKGKGMNGTIDEKELKINRLVAGRIDSKTFEVISQDLPMPVNEIFKTNLFAMDPRNQMTGIHIENHR